MASLNETELKTSILDKASAEMLSRGFKGVNLDDFCSELGISKKTLYRFFPTRSRLNEAVIDHFFTGVHTRMQAELTGPLADKPVQEKLRALFAVLSTALAEVNMEAVSEIQTSKPKLWNYLIERRTGLIHRIFGSLFRQARLNNEISDDIPIAFLEEMLAVLVERLGNPRTLAKLNMRPMDFINTMTKLLTGALQQGGPHDTI